MKTEEEIDSILEKAIKQYEQIENKNDKIFMKGFIIGICLISNRIEQQKEG